MAKSKKKLTPRDAGTHKAQFSLTSDNWNCKGGWILIDGDRVILTRQVSGESPTGQVEFTRRQFNTLIDWYQRPQSTSGAVTK